MTSSRSKRWPIIAIVALACVLAGLAIMSRQEDATKAREQLAMVEKLIADGRGDEALVIIQQRNRVVKKQSEIIRQKWLTLEAAALGQVGDGLGLLRLYERAPKTFDKQEDASLQVSRALLHVGDLERFDKLRAAWRGREGSPAGWFELDVDALLRKGDREEALKLLNSRSFEGAADCGRLLRLALVNLPHDPQAASAYLDRAVSVDNRNPEVHLHRGRMFEAAGIMSKANLEYSAAFTVNTNNSYFRDQLAEFYRRNGGYDRAAILWTGGLKRASANDSMWVRALFWTRVARTVPFDWATVEPPESPLEPFIRYLLKLPAGSWWNEAEFAKLPVGRYQEQLQEISWLRLLAALQAGNEDEALQLLATNRFRPNSYHLEIESALLRVINYRKHGEMKFPAGVTIPLNEAPPKARHQLFELLDALTKDSNAKFPEDSQRLLRSPDAFAAIFLAGGWPEAALQLPHQEIVPQEFPEWVTFGFAQALRFNRSAGVALEFIARQKSTPTLEMLAADILVSEGSFGDAILRLTPMAAQDSEEGARAARTTAEIYLRLKQYDEAQQAVTSRPQLERSTSGKELLARIAAQRGDKAAADKLYAGIESVSDEAKEYLARKAIAEKNWPRARGLIEELLKKYPDHPNLRASLESIAKAENTK